MAESSPNTSPGTTALDEFVNSISVGENLYPQDIDSSVDADIDKILCDIANAGSFQLKWKTHIMPIVAFKINQQFNRYKLTYGFSVSSYESFESLKDEIFSLLQTFDDAPFTVQRLVELIYEPDVSYKSTHKFMNGVLKLLSVTS